MRHVSYTRSAALLLASVAVSIVPMTPAVAAAAAACQADQPGGCVLPVRDAVRPAAVAPAARKGLGAAPILGGLALAGLIALLAFNDDDDDDDSVSPD